MWETGGGCPDISLLSALAEIFDTDIQVLLNGRADKNDKENGDMKKLRSYICKQCGNIITASAEASVTCCGSRLSPMTPKKASEGEQLKVTDAGGEWYVTSDHEMTKEHHISFVSYLNDSTMMMFRQHPEWGIDIHLPMYRSGRLVWYCTECGLLYQDIRPARR